MTQFASKTPYDHDPIHDHNFQPHADWMTDVTGAPLDTQECGECGERHQHNDPSPVLSLFRRQRGPHLPLGAHARGMLNGLTRLIGDSVDGVTIGRAHIDHARRVLIRLTKTCSQARDSTKETSPS